MRTGLIEMDALHFLLSVIINKKLNNRYHFFFVKKCNPILIISTFTVIKIILQYMRRYNNVIVNRHHLKWCKKQTLLYVSKCEGKHLPDWQLYQFLYQRNDDRCPVNQKCNQTPLNQSYLVR